MTMEELGELFTTARQEAGLSLEDVYHRTRISMYVLEGLESGDTAKLPHPVYTKGFIRSYAKLLGLDHEEIVHEYLALIGPVASLAIDTDIPELNVPRKLVKEKGSKYSLFLRIAFVLAIIAWLSVTYIFNETKSVPLFVENPEVTNDTGMVVSDVQIQDVTETEDMPEEESQGDEAANASNSTIDDVESVSANTTGQTATKTVNQSEELVLEGKVRGATQDVESSGDKNPGGIPTPIESPTRQIAKDETRTNSKVNISSGKAAVSAQPASNDKPKMRKHRLRIVATNRCWFKSIADKDVNPMKGEATLEPGQVMRLSFDKEMEIRVGNGGGVRLFVDGKPYPFKGVPDKPKTLVISMPGE